MTCLRELAGSLNISLVNANGNPHNTRQLGTLILRIVSAGRPAASESLDGR